MGPEESPSESDLIRAARGGSDTAFVSLCQRYESLLRATIRRRIVGPLQRKLSVADLIQETYLATHQGLPGFEDRGDGAFGGWIARIAELKAKEAVRRFLGTKKRDVGQEVTRGQRPDTEFFRGKGPSPSEVAIADEKHDAVFTAVESLPDDYRRVLQLVQVEHVTFDVAASLMGRSREAVRKLHGRALARLADLLDDDSG